MKITQEDQNKLEELIAQNTNSLPDFIRYHKQMVAEGKLKPKNCAATNCISRLAMTGDALTFVCDKIYKYADDSHLQTFYRKIYKKYS